MPNDDPYTSSLQSYTPTTVQQEMRTEERIPWEQQAIGAGGVGLLLGIAPATVLQKVACLPDFPHRVSIRPATWVAGEVLEWRDRNRVNLPRGRRRKNK